MNRDILTRPFPPELIRTRPGQNGKTFTYIPTFAVIERLNAACEQGWDFIIAEHMIYTDEVVVVGKLTADGVAKTAFGGSSITKDQSGRIVSLADDLKSAASDCLKKAATLLGVGLELYGAGRAAAPASTPQQQRPPAVESGDLLTGRQLGAIQSAARRHSVSQEELRALVFDVAGKDAPQFLTRREASALLDRLATMNGNVAHA